MRTNRNSDANQRLAREQVTTTSEVRGKMEGMYCYQYLRLRSPGRNWKHMAWLAEATRDTSETTLLPLTSQSREKERKALSSPSSHPPICWEFPSLANPARNCANTRVWEGMKPIRVCSSQYSAEKGRVRNGSEGKQVQDLQKYQLCSGI